MQLLKELVTVRLEQDNVEATFRCDELGLDGARKQASPIQEVAKTILVAPEEDISDLIVATVQDEPAAAAGKRRRRRRSGRRPSSAH
jgi:hypothetical protein